MRPSITISHNSRKTATMADHYLPIDILASILKKLPPKTLIKLLTISKSFYSLIKNPNFISSQFHHHRNHNHLFFLESNCRHSLCRHSQNFADRTLLTSPINPNGSQFHSVAGSCNGVVCLFNRNDRSLCLWNPTIHHHLILDPIPFLGNDLVLGFGFDSSMNDFKVVAIAPRLNFPQAQFYSLNSRTWKPVEFPVDSDSGVDICLLEACFVNGVIHWMMFDEYDDSYNGSDRVSAVLMFDVGKEVFRELGLPPGLGGAADVDVNLAVINDSLAILHYVAEESSYVVWQMKDQGRDESWRVLYRMKVTIPVSGSLNLGANWEGKDVIVTCSGSLIALNEESLSSRNEVDGEIVIFSGQAFCYTESLALLDKLSDPSWVRRGAITG